MNEEKVKLLNNLMGKIKLEENIDKESEGYKVSLAACVDQEGSFYYCYRGMMLFKFNDKKFYEKGLKVFLKCNDEVLEKLKRIIKTNKKLSYKRIDNIPSPKQIKKESKEYGEGRKMFVLERNNRITLDPKYLLFVYKILGNKNMKIYTNKYRRNPVRIKTDEGFCLLCGLMLEDKYYK